VRERYEADDHFDCDLGVEPLFCEDGCCREHDRCCGTAADTSVCNDVMLECTALCGLRDAAAGGAPQCAIAATAIAAADGARLCCGSPCKPGGMSFDEGDAPMSLRQWVQDYALSQVRRKGRGGFLPARRRTSSLCGRGCAPRLGWILSFAGGSMQPKPLPPPHPQISLL